MQRTFVKTARRIALGAAASAVTGFMAATVQAGPADTGAARTSIGAHVVMEAFASEAGLVRLQGHTPAGMPAKTARATAEPMTLTFVLRRDDEAGFQQFLRDVYDPGSPAFRRFVTPRELADRFGPSQQAYDALSSWLTSQHFAEVERSANRLTLTVSAPRQDVEAALSVRVDDYAGAERTFFANDSDPALPAAIAARVQAIVGLSDRARPAPLTVSAPPPDYYQCPTGVDPARCDLYGPLCAIYAGSRATGEFLMSLEGPTKTLKDFNKSYDSYNKNVNKYYAKCLNNNFGERHADAVIEGGPVPWNQIDGSGQTVGLVEFDQYQPSDISAYLEFIGADPAQINQLSEVIMGGGGNFGAAESEVVLDIDPHPWEVLGLDLRHLCEDEMAVLRAAYADFTLPGTWRA